MWDLKCQNIKVSFPVGIESDKEYTRQVQSLTINWFIDGLYKSDEIMQVQIF